LIHQKPRIGGAFVACAKTVAQRRKRTPMPLCPICKQETAAFADKAGRADGFDCPRHGKFKVSATVFSINRDKRASAEQWHAALEKARARQPSGVVPLILSYDF
jgi:hypothetical protein